MVSFRFMLVSVCVAAAVFMAANPGFCDKSDPKTFDGPFGVFFAVHMDPGMLEAHFERQDRNWPRLLALVDLAETYNVRLTLLFNPQWAEYILVDREKLDMLKRWQSGGHEVGLHYHMVTHTDWCGYTNRQDPAYTLSPNYLGTVADMMLLLNRLAAPAPVLTACVGPDIATKVYPSTLPVAPGLIDEIDYPEEICYDLDGFTDGVTRPIIFYTRGRCVFHLRHGKVETESQIQERLEEIVNAGEEEIVGFITHVSDYVPDRIESLFQWTEDQGIQISTVQDLMLDHPMAPENSLSTP